MISPMNWTIVHEFPAPGVQASWNEFLERADYPYFYVAPEYFLEPFLRDKKPFAILAWDDGRIVGVLTGMHEDNKVVSGFTSRPQTVFGISASQAAVADCLLDGLSAETGDDTLVTLYTWTEVPAFAARGYKHRLEDGVVMLDLTGGADALFKEFSSNRRTNVRKALKQGMDVSIATTREEFRAYYDIYVDWSQRKQLPYTTYDVMEDALMLTEHRKLFLARFEGKILAGVIIRVHPTGMIIYAANSSIKESLTLKPNDVLHWRVMEWACAQGYKRYNLGGAHLFLRKMGGTVIPSHRYRLDRTLLHRHDAKDALRASTSKLLHAMPEKMQRKVRHILRRDA